jgi:hypothetical protein
MPHFLLEVAQASTIINTFSASDEGKGTQKGKLTHHVL